MTRTTRIPEQIEHDSAANELRHQIAQIRIYRNAVLPFLGVAALFAFVMVVTTTVEIQAYTALSMTLWCGGFMVYLIVAAFSAIGARDHFTQGIHERQRALDALGEPEQVPPPIVNRLEQVERELRRRLTMGRFYRPVSVVAMAGYLGSIAASILAPSIWMGVAVGLGSLLCFALIKLGINLQVDLPRLHDDLTAELRDASQGETGGAA